jgi:RNA polymerase sigma factor (sigma-70 family)
MPPLSDIQLLRQYARHSSEEAFREIVARHANLVYSIALRQVESQDMAAEVAQRVFIDLAQRAATLSARLQEEASLAGWLCRSARNLLLKLRRDDSRRHSRERQAMEDAIAGSEPAPDWERLRPVLDDAMTELEESDYDAVVLRFFENQDLRSVGRALGISDDTAQKRVSRALDKLRGHLARRGISTTATALSIVLSANAVQTAPRGLVVTISSAAALAVQAVRISTAVSAAKTTVMTTIQKTLLATTLAAALGTGIYEALRAAQYQERANALLAQQDSLARQNETLQQERDETAKKLAAVEGNIGQSDNSQTELVRLRAEVSRLRADSRELAKLKATTSGQNAPQSPTESPSELVGKLRTKLAQTPDQTIPELQFLSEQDWLNAVKGMQRLETDKDFGRAFRALRSSAKKDFAQMLQNALANYSQANNGQSPADIAQLKPFFGSAVDASLLQRYEVTQPGIISEKANSLADQDDTYYQVNRDGVDVILGSVAEKTLSQAFQAYVDAHNGEKPKEPSQLRPYLKTPAEQAALQNLLQHSVDR